MSRKILTASEGKMLTDGEIYGKVIYLAECVDGASFYEITDREYKQIMLEDDRGGGDHA
ncbi:MAG: hypothetical protein IJC64_04415 [Clostridia bacterium]|nr:hypothetical protein [Clostridia bacterium]